MILDAHTHLHLDGQDRQGVSELLSSMKRAKIAKAAVFAATIGRGLTTEEALRITAPHQDHLFVIGTLSPLLKRFQRTTKDVERWLRSGRVRGLKLYTGYEHFYPWDKRLRPYLHLLVQFGYPAIFHCGDLYDQIPGAKLKYSHPFEIDELAAEMPELKIVIAHMGSPFIREAAQVCYKNANVYADTSGFVYGGFNEKQRRRFTRYWHEFMEISDEKPCKLLFGSDWPISHMRDYIAVVRKLAGKSLCRTVFHGNAAKLFGL